MLSPLYLACVSCFTAMKDERCNWPRGKVLGGSSVLNYMMYVRGNQMDYDSWLKQGNPGWGYDDVLYYFKKSEDNRNPYLARTPYHSMGGYLTVSEAPYKTPLADAFVRAGQEMGYEIRDINGERQTGFMIPQGTIRRGARCSTAKAFLRPARLRKNLHVSISAQVTRVAVDPETKVAYGVEMVKGDTRYFVRASKEVILSAGSIGSAQLLMLSGIGPKNHLTEMGIPVLADLDVGKNLQDHVGLGGLAFLINKQVMRANLVEIFYTSIKERGKINTFLVLSKICKKYVFVQKIKLCRQCFEFIISFPEKNREKIAKYFNLDRTLVGVCIVCNIVVYFVTHLSMFHKYKIFHNTFFVDIKKNVHRKIANNEYNRKVNLDKIEYFNVL